MSLEDDLKARALQLISQQMANWVVDIQRRIQEQQGNFVRSLDELSESVARYDEKIDEGAIAQAMAEAVAASPASASGPGMDRLRAALVEIERGVSLSEVLTYLVNEASHFVERAAMFIVKGPNAIGWYARGVEPADAVKHVNVPLAADTVFRNISHSRQAMRGHLSHTPGTAQAMSRLGGQPQAVMAVPLLLQRDKLAAILYCDSREDEIPTGVAALVEILVLFAAKSIDLLSAAPKTTAAPAGARITLTPAGERAPVAAPPPPRPAAPAAAGGGEDVGAGTVIFRPQAPPPPRPAPPPPAPADEGAGTVMFKAGSLPTAPPRPPAPAPAPAPPRPAAPAGLSPDEQKAHDDAKRFARLVVSEIKLYNEAKVSEGRRQKDLYERLKEDIERGRAMYTERVSSKVRDTTNYFVDELVRILAGGDTSALGPM